MKLTERLQSRAGASASDDGHRAELFDCREPEGAARLERLLENHPHLRVRDTLRAQVAELLATRSPEDPRADDDTRVDAYLDQHGGPEAGVWAYFPWRAELVRILSREDFIELRTNRNKLLITDEEQRLLRTKRIAIVGLSVGHSMATTLALEGVGGAFLLADPDALELSNTNRLPAGLSALGSNKARLAAQRMAEIDPYLDVEVWCGGVDRDDPDRLFRDHAPDLLLEECDDLVLKVALRERARDHGVPVVTETSQRGLIDVERFDREPQRPLLHGLLGGVEARALAGLSTRQKGPFGLRFMQGVERLDSRLAASLLEIEQSLRGWPQLGSAVTFGGGMVADVVRRVLLGTFTQSGRFRVDLGRLVADDSPIHELGRAPEPHPTPTEAPAAPVRSPAAYLGRGLRGWLEAAVLAPSGGNSQPWRFQLRGERGVRCRLDPERSLSALDPRGLGAYLACGAAFEQLRMAAAADGFEADVSWQCQGDGRVFEAQFRPSSDVREEALWANVPYRCTNRRLGDRSSLPAAATAALRERAQEAGAALQWIDDPDALDEVAGVLGELERIRVLSPALHSAMVAELRLGPDSAAAPDGISEATLELDDSGRAALAVLRRRDVVSLLSQQEAGGALRRLAAESIAAASGFGRLSLPGDRPLDFALGGVALARVWLEATARGLALQPMGAGAFMLAQLDFEPGESRLNALDFERLRAVLPAFRRCFPLSFGADGLLFRVHEGPEIRARSARLPLSAVLDD